MGHSKELVTTMVIHENILMGLMPLSLIGSVYLIMSANTAAAVYKACSLVSGFYLAWALLNKFTTKPYEKGHIPLGLCFGGCAWVQAHLGSDQIGGCLAILGAAGTWLAFAIAGFTRVFVWPASKTAYVSKKTLLWAHTLRLYFATSLCSWAYFTYRLVKAL